MVELLFQTNNPRSVGAWLNVKALTFVPLQVNCLDAINHSNTHKLCDVWDSSRSSEVIYRRVFHCETIILIFYKIR